MEVNDALVDKLAMLSRLHFNENEKQEIKSDLQKMIGFIDTINALNTSDVEPLLHISSQINNLRDDIAFQHTSQEEALQNSPVKDARFFKVPTVIKK